MTDYFTNSKGDRVYYLTKECVIDLHNLLSQNFHLLQEMDPVEPRGIKSINMLESAISRQMTGFGNYFKYDDVFTNAATLAYGVIKNHAFHNGNKRAGLLSLIKHLYTNGYVLNPSLNSEELYQIMISIADSKLNDFHHKHRKKYIFYQTSKPKKENNHWDSEVEVNFIALWIKKNAKSKQTNIKGDIRISDLKRILNNKNIELEQNGNTIEVFQLREKKIFRLIPHGEERINRRTYFMGSNKSFLPKTILNNLRKDYDLTASNGYDDTFFYDDNAFLDSEIMFYKTLIYKLSRT